MSLKEIFKLVLGWRFLIIVIALPAIFILPARTRFTNLTAVPSIANIFSMWSNFDGLHYLDIAEFGYGYQQKTDMDYAFFPVYPLVVRLTNLFGNYLASGLLVSHLSFVLALFYLYKLVRLDLKPKTAKSVIYLVLIYPTAFFFGSVYSESIFFLLVVLSFYYIRQKKVLTASLFAALASAARITGIFLWPVLIYEYWLVYGEDVKSFLRKQESIKVLPNFVSLLLPPLGLLAYMRFQYLKTGDPLFFLTYQENFTGRTIDKLILLHQVYFRYAKMLIFIDHLNPLFFTVLLEFLTATLALLVIIFSLKKIRFSYWLFSLLSFLLPTFTGTFASMPRFTLVLFPLFIFLAGFLERVHPYLRYAYYALCFLFSILSIAFFTRGYFIG